MVDAAAVDNGDDRRHAAGDQIHAAAADRASEGGDEVAAAAGKLLNLINAGFKAAEYQRLIQRQAAAGADGEGFTAGEARAGDAQGKIRGCAALVGAGLQNDLVNHQRRAAVAARVAEMGRVKLDRMNPLRKWAAAVAGITAAEIAAEAIQAQEMKQKIRVEGTASAGIASAGIASASIRGAGIAVAAGIAIAAAVEAAASAGVGRAGIASAIVAGAGITC